MELSKWVLHCRSWFGTLIPQSMTVRILSLYCHSDGHAWMYLWSFNLLSHCRQYSRDWQYEWDRGIRQPCVVKMLECKAWWVDAVLCDRCREQRAMLASELEKNSDSFSPPETHRVLRTSPAVSMLPHYSLQCESKKIPPEDLWQFFQNGWEFFNQILWAYYAFLSTLEYEFLFNYLQIWRSYAILSTTTQFTSCDALCKMSTIGRNAFSDIFPKRLGIFSPNFIRLLHVPVYAGLQIFIQLSATLTKLCHIKREHHNVQCSKCPPSTATHAGWSHLIWHNFVTVGDNWTKFSFCRMCECLIGM